MKRLLLVLAAASLAGSALAGDPADPAVLYGAKCGPCHAKDGKGTSVGKKMGVPDLTTLAKSEKEIADTIAGGKGKMAAFKDKLSAEDIQKLARYVKGGLK